MKKQNRTPLLLKAVNVARKATTTSNKMKHTITFIALLLPFTTMFGQNKFEPQILILSPNDVTYDKSFEKEIAAYNILIKQNNKYAKQEKELKSKEFQKQPVNIKKMMESEISFGKTLDFVKQISFTSEQFLAYRFFEKFPNLLIQSSNTISKGEIAELKKISDQEKLQHILNFPSVKFYRQDGISFAKLSVQLYDRASNTLLIEIGTIPALSLLAKTAL